MKRRSFIAAAGAGIAAISVPAIFYYQGSIEYDPILVQPQSLAHIWDPETITAIGNEYCRQFPREAKVRSLVKRLLGDAPSDNNSLAGWLGEQVAHDFQTDNTVLVDGWILSQTEARQCALFFLTQTN